MLKLYSSQLVPHTKGLQRAQPVPVSVLAVHSTHANVAPTAPRVASEWRHTQSRLLCRSAAPSTGGATSPAGTSSVPPQLVPPTDPNSYCVLNFYHLTPVENPQEVSARGVFGVLARGTAKNGSLLQLQAKRRAPCVR